MALEIIILTMALPILAILFWAKAPSFYEYHRNLKEHYPRRFRLLGFNEKYIHYRDRWIRHYRAYVVLMTILMLSIPLIVLLFAGDCVFRTIPAEDCGVPQRKGK